MNILLINGHPDSKSYCHALAESYKKGAAASGTAIKEINIGQLGRETWFPA